MLLSIMLVCLFKHTLQAGRLRQVMASVTNSEPPSAGGQLVEPIPAANRPSRGARRGPLAGGWGQPPSVAACTVARLKKQKQSQK